MLGNYRSKIIGDAHHTGMGNPGDVVVRDSNAHQGVKVLLMRPYISKQFPSVRLHPKLSLN